MWGPVGEVEGEEGTGHIEALVQVTLTVTATVMH